MTQHTKESLLELVQKIRYDTTAIQAKVTELQRAIAALNLPSADTPLTCPKCGIEKRGQLALDEHLENVHDFWMIP
jgi:hypothetical protein